MSLYVRVNSNFFTHRKTAKLRRALGDDAFWLPPRWWAYAADNQPDGIFKDYTAPELADALGYTKDPFKMLEALLQAGFADADPLRIHDWQDYNGYHLSYSERAKKAATVRWQKERTKEKDTDKTGGEKSQALLGASDTAKSQQMLENPLPKFEAVPKKLFPHEYATLLADAKTQLKKTLESLVERNLTPAAKSFIEWVEKNEASPDVKARKIKEATTDRKSFTAKLTAVGEAHKKCWLDRIEEIERAARGQI